MDVEVLSALRRAVAKKNVAEARALAVIEDLSDWQVDRISHRVLARLAWRYRHNTSAYDAFYVAAARLYDVPLLTADGPLSRAPGLVSCCTTCWRSRKPAPVVVQGHYKRSTSRHRPGR